MYEVQAHDHVTLRVSSYLRCSMKYYFAMYVEIQTRSRRCIPRAQDPLQDPNN